MDQTKERYERTLALTRQLDKKVQSHLRTERKANPIA